MIFFKDEKICSDPCHSELASPRRLRTESRSKKNSRPPKISHSKKRNSPPSINSFSPLPTWIFCFANPKILPHTISYLLIVTKDFFLLQYLRKLKLVRIPILNVESELDKKIPFVPKNIFVYLDFVNFWIRPLSMLVKILGVKKSSSHFEKFFWLLKKTYRCAGQIYRFRMTTTRRPLYKKRTRFVIMRMLDPHFLCVPSLHIAIVVLCYAFFRDVLKKENFSDEEKNLWTGEIYSGAVKIAQAVLDVKQHSINCVCAALYMMTKVIPKYFSFSDAKKFLDDMFFLRSDIPQNEKTEICEYMKKLFSRFFEEGLHSANWSLPIKKWLLECAAW